MDEFAKFLFERDRDLYDKYMEILIAKESLKTTIDPIVVDGEGKLLYIFGVDMAIDPNKSVYAYRMWDYHTNMFFVRVDEDE